ncbi:MAG: hypothetical protein JWN24_3887 [Phycisphaerales bacterium]|nr:hypothetical protein [Phycisphaerales bacterium]
MSSLPPPVPTPLNYAPPPPRNDLRVIAVRQKAIMYCILGYVVLIIGQFALPAEVRIIATLLAACVSITAAVFVFMLALAVYNTATGIALGILTLIPLVGLLVLRIINSKATNILREHGIRVGLMGADSSQIPGPG